MKVDGNKFMEWLHKIREEDTREKKRIGFAAKRIKNEMIADVITKKYNIPIVSY